MTNLDDLRRKRYTSYQLRLKAAQSGCAVTAAEADAQTVVERLRKGPYTRVVDPFAIDAAEAARLLTEAFRPRKNRRLY